MMEFIDDAGDEGDPTGKVAAFFGPAHIDQLIRQAVQHCWMILPKDRRTPEELERQVRRMVDRAVKDFREDREAFGK